MAKNLFVPLTKKFFHQFKSGGKRFELRRLGKRWNTNQVYPGRGITLSKGYGKKDRIRGIIGTVYTGSLRKIFKLIPFKLLVVDAKSKREAIESVEFLLGNIGEFIAFEFIPNRKTDG